MPPAPSLGWFDRLTENVLGQRRGRVVRRWIEHQKPSFHASMRRLASMKDIHRGKRCFILGNGPSLNRTDLSLLQNEFTFATNRINLMFDRTPWRPSYYACSNELVAEQFAADIAKIDCPKFIGWHCRHAIPFADDVTYLWTRNGLRSWFFTDLTEGCWEGNTVTMVCLQLAFHMGFSEVVLIGVDHSYQYQGSPHEPQVCENKHDPNHFAGDYFANGLKWHLPDLEGSELAYRIADFMFRRNGRRVVDATIGGKLTVFPKVEYASLFPRRAVA